MFNTNDDKRYGFNRAAYNIVDVQQQAQITMAGKQTNFVGLADLTLLMCGRDLHRDADTYLGHNPCDDAAATLREFDPYGVANFEQLKQCKSFVYL